MYDVADGKVTMDEFLAVDMGCIGLDLAGDEHSVSICAKDSSGPYDYDLTTRLINYAKEHNFYNISLEVRESNSAAISLYEICGFEKCGIRKSFYRFPKKLSLLK